MSDAYQQMLRDVIRSQGDPANFQPRRLMLDDAQLAIALREYDDMLVEVAGEVQGELLKVLDGTSPYLTEGATSRQVMGLVLCGALRDRAERRARKDAEGLALDMAAEDHLDDEYMRGAA